MSDVVMKTPLEMLYYWAKTKPNQVFMRQPVRGVWHDYTWAEIARQASVMAAALRHLGCQPGDRVALFSKNCAHWIIADLAILQAGCVSVPLYPTQQAESIDYILRHSEAKAIFVGKLDQWQAMESGIPAGIHRISFPYPDPMPADYTWDELLQKTQPMQEQFKPSLDQLATIIYTSGTTGVPKGVMHSFRTMANAAVGYREAFSFSSKDRFLSYLPLSHVAERILVEMNGIYSGALISFAESLETFAQNLRDVAPTAFFSVPRLWKKFQLGILDKIPQHKLDKLLRIPIVSQLVKRKIRIGLGLNSARSIGSGAAPIAPSLLAWYHRLGIEIREGYGLTENFGYATTNRPGQGRVGTVGTAQAGTDIMLLDGGEIVVKNASAMLGYYKDPAATAEVLCDGAIRTGDMGEMDADGYLKITGRFKEIFKTDKGKYIAPGPIEHIFMADNHHIEQLCIMGHALPSPVAVCVLTEAARRHPEAFIVQEFHESLKRVNGKLDKHERIDHCILIQDEWTVESGIMTPTLKIKRHQVEKQYQGLVAQTISNKSVVRYIQL